MLYCKINNDLISDPQPLPINYMNVSNFYLLDEDLVNSYGFYRFVDSVPPEYNPYTSRLVKTYVKNDTIINPSYLVESLSQEEITANFNNVKILLANVTESYMDYVVSQKDYKSVLHACSYAESSIPQYKNEALAVIAWRDSVWATAYQIQSDVLSGNRSVPSEQELISELPTIEWPE